MSVCKFPMQAAQSTTWSYTREDDLLYIMTLLTVSFDIILVYARLLCHCHYSGFASSVLPILYADNWLAHVRITQHNMCCWVNTIHI